MAQTPPDDPTYALGRSREEHQRLAEQAAFLQGLTRRLWVEGGIEPGMRVLDFGSGVGDVAFLTAELVGDAGEVVGIDLDETAVETASRRAEAADIPNVRFLAGDLRDAELDGGFDAVVGRLVLLYLADPTDGLRAAAARLRSGGLLVFQELDMEALVMTPEDLWVETARRIIEAFRRAGVHTRMGAQLYETFVAADLPAPTLRSEILMGGGDAFGGYRWLAGVARSLAPLMEQTGIVESADELALDTLADRIRDEVVAAGRAAWTPPFIGAYSRTSPAAR